jgi:hypothetical protein
MTAAFDAIDETRIQALADSKRVGDRHIDFKIPAREFPVLAAEVCALAIQTVAMSSSSKH